MNKITAMAPANIAFIKYWGKQNENLRLPVNSSISMNLSGVYTNTTVEFSHEFKSDEIKCLDKNFNHSEKIRIIQHLDRIRKLAKINLSARVVTRNNFPRSVGIASSASGFAALTLAGSIAAGLNLSPKELTILARLGSGSACRSIPDGFVEWLAGNDSESSYAYSLYDKNYWDICDLLVLVSSKAKHVSTTGGMEKAATSPLWPNRTAQIPTRISQIKLALKDKNFSFFGEVLEEECLEMHAVMQSQNPPLNYWTDETKMIMQMVGGWRRDGIAVYFTIDAGPNVHIILEKSNVELIKNKLREKFSPDQMIVNNPADGAHLISESLF